MSPAVLKALSKKQRPASSSARATSSFETAVKNLTRHLDSFLDKIGESKFTHWRSHTGIRGQTVFHFFCQEESGSTPFERPFSAREVVFWLLLQRAKKRVKYPKDPKQEKNPKGYERDWRVRGLVKNPRMTPRFIISPIWRKKRTRKEKYGAHKS